MAAAELELLDYKRRVHALYARVRAEPDPACAFAVWVAERDDLFARHPQSALPADRRAGFEGLCTSRTTRAAASWPGSGRPSAGATTCRPAAASRWR